MARAKSVLYIILLITVWSTASFDLNVIASPATRVAGNPSRRTTSGRTDFSCRQALAPDRRPAPTALREALVPVDVLSSTDLVNGTLIALVLAFTASFLQGRRNQNDFVLWEPKTSMNATTADSSSPPIDSDKIEGIIFDGDAWKEIGRPENYVLFNRRIRQRQTGSQFPPSRLSTSVPVERAWVLVGLLVLFVPIFSIEFFFALSRQVFCGGSPMDQPDWAMYLCSPATVP